MNAEQHEWYWRGYNDAKKENKREFVGLTPTDMQKLSAEWWTPNENEVVLINWIEAKLKDKNNG